MDKIEIILSKKNVCIMFEINKFEGGVINGKY